MQRLELESVSKTYGGFFALHRVSATFRAGRISALVGDNGSGKTTLLTILATLEKPSDGTIQYDDLSWESFADHYRDRVGWIAHDSLTYGELSGRENLQLYGDLYGVDRPAEVADEWLERVGLGEAADRRAHDYSRGMRERLAIARALLHDPDLLLLDEPFSGLDRGGREQVAELLEHLREREKVLLLASHDLEAVGELADSVRILQRGTLADTATSVSPARVSELYREYA